MAHSLLTEYDPFGSDAYLPRIDRYRSKIKEEIQLTLDAGNMDSEYREEMETALVILEKYPEFSPRVLDLLEDDRKIAKNQEGFRRLNVVAWRLAAQAGENPDWIMDELCIRLLAGDMKGENTIEENAEAASIAMKSELSSKFYVSENYIAVRMHPLGTDKSPIFWSGHENGVLLAREIPETMQSRVLEMPLEQVVAIPTLNGLDLTIQKTKKIKVKNDQRECKRALPMYQTVLVTNHMKLFCLKHSPEGS